MIFEYKFDRGVSGGHGHPKPLLYEIDSNGCWNNVSHAVDKDGYGKIQYHKKYYRIHRLIYELENNIELLPHEIVMHTCDNPRCFNPSHLKLGTSQDNMQDKINKNRQAKNEQHGRHKLTDEQVIEIYKASGSQQSIADKYNVSQNLVSKIKRKVLHTDIINKYLLEKEEGNNLYGYH